MQRTLYKAAPVDPKALSQSERDALAAELYAVQRQIFAGVGEEDFRAYVVDSPAPRTRIEVYRADGPDGEAVGYSAVHVFDLVVAGVRTKLLRAEVGLLPDWRGRTAAGRIITSEAIRAMVSNPLGRTCFLACPVHPASYLCLARSSKSLYPRPDRETPQDVVELMAHLDEALGLQRPSGSGELVRKVGWITQQSASEQGFWQDHDSELVRFYVENNPGYIEGDGLIVVIPATLSAALDGTWNQASRQLRRAWRRVQRRLGAGPLAPVFGLT